MPLLSNHVKKVHDNADSSICHVCAKTFKSVATYNFHCESMHPSKPIEKVQCSRCGKW